ncbi:hypothetical protein RUND412_007850 [Rhizina undulata]
MTEFKKIGVVGAGSMGSNMAMLFAENGLYVSIFDINETNVIETLSRCEETPSAKGKVFGFHEYKPFLESLETDTSHPKLLLLSIPHGFQTDEVLESTKKFLNKGDIILDGGNEWYRNTERRQKNLEEMGTAFIGMGVSGGYQSARHGSSMSPGGDARAIDKVLPLLKKVAAKVTDGTPCVRNIGPGGSGHYVKMAHNGIEQGMLSALSEVWEILFKCLNTNLEEISRIFMKWNIDGELKNNFLVNIGSDICLRRKDHGTKHILNEVQDKVVQDADDSEGTGFWTVRECAERHASAPTISAAHFYRVASANRMERLQFFEFIGGHAAAKKAQHIENRENLIEDLRLGLYCAFLASFAQGLNLIAKASKDENWGVRLSDCIKIWRAGCIIQSDYIADLFESILEKNNGITNVLLQKEIAEEIKRTMPALKRVVQNGVEWDAHIPALSASLEYFKYCGGKHLPTQFMEAQLDYFGAHSYDLKSEDPGEVKKGTHHHEWKSA